MKVEYWRYKGGLISFSTSPTHLTSGRCCHYTIFYSESFGTPELLVRISHEHRSAFPFRYSVFDKADQFIGYTFLWKIYMSILNLNFIYVSFYRPLRSCPKKLKRPTQFCIQLCGVLNKNGSPKAHIFQYLVTREWPYLRRNRSIRSCGLVGGNMSLGVGFEVSKIPHQSTIFL